MKSKLIILSAVVLVFSAGQVFASGGHGEMADEKGSMMEHKGSMMKGNNSESPNVGNKICPVSGEKVGKMGESVQVEHEGKVYNLCCTMCAKDFKKNPEKFIKKVNEELKASGHEMSEGMEGHDE